MREMSTLTALNASTIRLLGSTQVISSVFSVVKELTENALDADASIIDVRLENFGLDKVEVRDNGTGIPSKNVPYVAKRYHTSKIVSFSDIENVETYGFRGEALGSLCTVSTLSITTKTTDDDVSLTYSFNNQGQITSSRPSHLTQGTTITSTGLFKNMPVRRQFYNTNKKKKEDVKRIEDLLVAFSIILPKVRFTLTHDKERVWQKSGVSDTKTALLGILGRNVLNNLVHKTVELEDPKVTIDMYLPSATGDAMVTSRADNTRCINAINNRPLNLKYVEKVIKQHYVAHFSLDSHRHPVYFLSITIATNQIDVNIDPNKTMVLLHHKKEIVKVLTSVLEDLYGSISKAVNGKDSPDGSFSENQKGDNSSDDSFSIPPVINKQPNIPVFKITTDVDIESESLTLEQSSTLKCLTTDAAVEIASFSVDENLEQSSCLKGEDLTKIMEEGIENEDDISLTQLGKPVFQIMEVSLDDLINDKQENSLLTNDNSIENSTDVQGITLNNGKCSSGNNFESPLQDNRFNKNLQKEGNFENKIDFKTNPQLSEVYGDIVSSWKDSQVKNTTEDKQPQAISTNETVGNILTNQNTDSMHGSAYVNAGIVDSTNEKVDSILTNQNTESSNAGILGSTNDLADLDKIGERKFHNGDGTATSGGDLWSKGKSLNADGSDIQPVTLLQGKRLLSPAESDEPPQKKRHVLVQEDGQRMLSDIVCSQPVKHPHTAFTLYSKEHRSKVVSENPLADYDKVTSILETSWQSLPDEERDKFFQNTSPVATKLKCVNTGSEKKERKIGKKMKLHSKNSSQSWTTIKDQLLKQKASTAPLKEKTLNFSLQNLQAVFSQKLFASQSQESSIVNLIGPLKTSGVWVGCRGNNIRIISPHRIQETVLYHNLLANHIVESEKLEQPLQLTESYLGDTLWTTLRSLADKVSGMGTYNVLQDKRLTGNGIEITFHKEETHFSAKITGLTRGIPVYGIADVKEILQLISTTGAVTLSQSRPLKVLNYLQGEAVRMARKLPRQQTKEDMIDLLIQMETVLPQRCETCLHNKPFYHTLYSLDQIPLTQSQS